MKPPFSDETTRVGLVRRQLDEELPAPSSLHPPVLPWVDDIVARYLYLKYPDGLIPIEELNKYVKR